MLLNKASSSSGDGEIAPVERGARVGEIVTGWRVRG